VTVSHKEHILGDAADMRIVVDEFVIFELRVERISGRE
jgi:hypothetical protein